MSAPDFTPENGAQQHAAPEASDLDNALRYMKKQVRQKHNDHYQERGDTPPLPEISKRTLWSMITGAVSGVAAWFSASMYAQDKMLPFEVEYQKRSVELITGRGGIGAAAADAGLTGVPHVGGYGNGFGNFGTGLSSHLIESAAHDTLILENPQKYNFAKWMRRIGGKGNFSMGAGVAAGAVVGLATYALLKDRNTNPEQAHDQAADWQSKSKTDKDQPRNLG